MAKVTLTKDEKKRIEGYTDEELRATIESNERKRRKVIADKKAYASACAEMISMHDAVTDHALEVLEQRAISGGVIEPPRPKVVAAS